MDSCVTLKRPDNSFVPFVSSWCWGLNPRPWTVRQIFYHRTPTRAPLTITIKLRNKIQQTLPLEEWKQAGCGGTHRNPYIWKAETEVSHVWRQLELYSETFSKKTKTQKRMSENICYTVEYLLSIAVTQILQIFNILPHYLSLSLPLFLPPCLFTTKHLGVCLS